MGTEKKGESNSNGRKDQFRFGHECMLNPILISRLWKKSTEVRDSCYCIVQMPCPVKGPPGPVLSLVSPRAWTTAYSPVGVWKGGDQGAGHKEVRQRGQVWKLLQKMTLFSWLISCVSLLVGCIPGCLEDDFSKINLQYMPQGRTV